MGGLNGKVIWKRDMFHRQVGLPECDQSFKYFVKLPKEGLLRTGLGDCCKLDSKLSRQAQRFMKNDKATEDGWWAGGNVLTLQMVYSNLLERYFARPSYLL